MNSYSFTALQSLGEGEVVFVARKADDGDFSAYIDTELPPAFFPVGTTFTCTGELHKTRPCCMVVQNGYSPVQSNTHSVEGMWVKMHCAMGKGDSCTLSRSKEHMSLAWVTLSDKGVRGLREDSSGPQLEKLVRERYELTYSRGYIIPDDELQIRQLLVDLALNQKFDLILTTGGTGVAPRDVTPEATVKVIDKRLKGMEQAMMAASLAKTPHAVISRAVAGTLGSSVIINMPGSKKAVAENLEAVLPALGHTIAKLQGDPADCGNL